MPDCAIQLSQNVIVCLLASDQSKTIKYNKWRICKIFIAVRVTSKAEIAMRPSIAFFQLKVMAWTLLNFSPRKTDMLPFAKLPTIS